MRALIIIDMQQGSFSPEDNIEALVARLNKLSTDIRAANGLVIWVQHDGVEGTTLHPDTPGWQLLKGLDTMEDDGYMRKASCDAFIDTNLEGLLKAAGARELIICGCATEYCVDSTIRSALGRGYPTFAPSDGHTTGDKPHMPARDIIRHHNSIWATFGSPAGAATVCPVDEIEF